MVDRIDIARARHEPRDVRLRFIWAATTLVVATVVLLAILVRWLFPGSLRDQTMHLPLNAYPEPALQIDARDDMARFRHRELERLDSAGWLDRAHGVVHIPIDRAMAELAASGIPDWPTEPSR